MVYTEDAADQADVDRVLAGLRHLGITQRLTYKADQNTFVLTYAKGVASYVAQPCALTSQTRTPRSPD